MIFLQGPQSDLFIPSIHPAVNVRGKRPREFPAPKVVKAEPVDPLEPVDIAVPVYVPPKPKNLVAPVPEPRGAHLKVKRRIIVGNVSKWLNPEDRSEDMSTHKWMIYVRGDKDFPDVSDVVEKVRFLIHQRYSFLFLINASINEAFNIFLNRICFVKKIEAIIHQNSVLVSL